MNQKHITKNIFSVLTIFSLFFPYFNFTNAGLVIEPTCCDECSYYGQPCPNGGTCRQYDSDPCLECPPEEPPFEPPSFCNDECSYFGQIERRCFGNYVQKRVCGNYDSDPCLEWSNWQNEQNCGTSGWTDNYRCSSSRYLEREYINRGCSNAQCFANSEWRQVQDCGTDSWTENYRCSGNWVQREKIKRGCSNNSCYQNSVWENIEDCSLQGKICQNGQCVLPQCECTPWSNWRDKGCGQGGCAQNQMWQERTRCCTPSGCASESETRCIEDPRCEPNDPVSGTLSVAPSTTPCVGEYVIFTISARDNQGVEKVCLDSNCQSCNFQTNCTKTWQITKNTPGTFTFSGTVFGKKPDGSQESASTNPASISITWRNCNRPPIANAGPDKEVLETQSTILEGSGSDPDSDPITFSWVCSGGTLSNPNIAQPTFMAPAVSFDTLFSCTLTVTDSKGAQSSDSMNVLVRAQTLFVTLEAIPNSGSAPLNNVDLKATVFGTAIGPITYKFDCTGDGTFEKIITTNENPYTAVDLCNFPTGGTFNAKVYAERGAADPAWGQATILVSSPYPTVDLKVNGSDGPISVPYNSSVTLSWTSNNVTFCQASGDWLGPKGTSGSEIISGITSHKIFVINCTGPSGTASDSVTVYVSQPSPSVDLKVNGQDDFVLVPYGSSVTLTWTSANANSCYASGNWSGAKPLSGSETISNITSYRIFTITCTGNGKSASDSVTVNIILPVRERLSIDKTVRNLSKGTEFSKRIEAEPNEVLIFGITIRAGSTPLNNVIIKDILPPGIIYRGDLKIDNVAVSGNILTGISLGNLAAGQTKTIVFKADIAGPQNFSLGQTELTNTAIALVDGLTFSDEAKIIVTKRAIAGGITALPTGIRDHILFDSFFLPLVFAGICVWAFKSKIINFEKWLDLKKKEAAKYKAQKLLQFKIAKLKMKSFIL